MYNAYSSFEVLFIGAATVGGQEGHCGSKIRAGVSCYPCETADQGLICFTALDTEFIVLVDSLQRDGINGTTRPVGSCDWVEVDCSVNYH